VYGRSGDDLRFLEHFHENKVVLPSHYDPEKPYPGALAFPGGPQAMVKRNWRDQAERRGYIVVTPATPKGRLFFQGGERVSYCAHVSSLFLVDDTSPATFPMKVRPASERAQGHVHNIHVGELAQRVQRAPPYL
jgi:hypothetical protein